MNFVQVMTIFFAVHIFVVRSSPPSDKIIDIVLVIDQITKYYDAHLSPNDVKEAAIDVGRIFLDHKRNASDTMVSVFTVATASDGADLIVRSTDDYEMFKNLVNGFSFDFVCPDRCDKEKETRDRAAIVVKKFQDKQVFRQIENHVVPAYVIWIVGYDAVYTIDADVGKSIRAHMPDSVLMIGFSPRRQPRHEWFFNGGHRQIEGDRYQPIYDHIMSLLEKCGRPMDDRCFFVDYQQQTCKINRTFNTENSSEPYCFSGFIEYDCERGRQGCVDTCENATEFSSGPCSCENETMEIRPSGGRYQFCDTKIERCTDADLEICAPISKTAPTSTSRTLTTSGGPERTKDEQAQQKKSFLKDWHIGLIVIGTCVLLISPIICCVFLRQRRASRRSCGTYKAFIPSKGSMVSSLDSSTDGVKPPILSNSRLDEETTKTEKTVKISVSRRSLSPAASLKVKTVSKRTKSKSAISTKSVSKSTTSRGKACQIKRYIKMKP